MGEVPRRIQRKRVKGWKMPLGAVYIGRPSRWGNPFIVGAPYMPWLAIALGCRGDRAGQQRAAVRLYEAWLTRTAVMPLLEGGSGDAIEFTSGAVRSTEQHCRSLAIGFATMKLPVDLPEPPTLEEVRAQLGGRSLACFCPEGEECHGDVLLRLANTQTKLV